MKGFWLAIMLASLPFCHAVAYHVDFDSGSDSNDGLYPSTAWKHAPGDSSAAGIPASKALQPGDRLLFKGGVVYRGTFLVASGSNGRPIEYIGNEWGSGKAIIDGTEPFEPVWELCDCAGHPLNGQIYTAALPEGTGPFSGIYENGDFLWLSQDPEPSDHFFWDHFEEYNVIDLDDPTIYQTRTAITDPDHLTQPTPDYWDGAYVSVWRIPNVVVTKKVTGFDPLSDTITHEDLGGEVYDDRDAYYAMLNHLDLIDTPGEYAIDEDADRLFIYPRGNINGNTYSISERGTGIKINNRNNFVIRGFIIQNTEWGINTGGNAGGGNSMIAENEVRNLRSNDHYAIQVSGDNILIKDNKVTYNQRAVGILCSGGNITVENNHVEKCSRQGIWFMGATDSRIIGNTVVGPGGAHANGISIYSGSSNNLIARNVLRNIGSSITYQNGDGFYFVGNSVLDGGATNSWGGTTDAVFLNNLFTGFVNSPEATVFVNNIVHGGGSGGIRTHNIYTNLSWSQEARYGWSLAEGEILQKDKGKVYDLEGRIVQASPAIDNGTNPVQYLPGMFSDAAMTDLDGNDRPSGEWDIGPYEYSGGCMSTSALQGRINGWLSGRLSIADLMLSIRSWKGCA